MSDIKYKITRNDQEYMTQNEEKNQFVKTDTKQTWMLKQQKKILEQFLTVFHMFKKKSGYVKGPNKPSRDKNYNV